jgi:hypothetical protein
LVRSSDFIGRSVASASRRGRVFNREQLGFPASDAGRDTLAWIALGVWRPGLDEVSKLNALDGFVVPWYGAGLG